MNIHAIEFEVLLKEAIFGLLVMGAVAVVNIYSFTWISWGYRRALKKSVFHGLHFEMFRFVGRIMLLVITMLMSLSIWVFVLSYFDFVSDWKMALLFVASFFTSVGNISLDLPFGWRLIPPIITFSGLFSFAWATASSISMANSLSLHLEKHHQS